MNDKRYTAIICDVVNSRENDICREHMQKFLKDVIKNLNKIFNDYIIKEVMFGAGDEFQGLFRDTVSACRYIFLLNKLIAPIKVRCGIGVGSILYLDKSFVSTELDGDVYRKARIAINKIYSSNNEEKNLNGKSIVNKTNKLNSNIIINSYSNADPAFNVLFEQLYGCVKNYTNLRSELSLVANLISPIDGHCFNKNDKKIIINLFKSKNEFIFLTRREVENMINCNMENDEKTILILEKMELYGKYTGIVKGDKSSYKNIDVDLKLLEKNIFNQEYNIETKNESINIWKRGFSKLISDIFGINQASISDSKKNLKLQRELESTIYIFLKELFK